MPAKSDDGKTRVTLLPASQPMSLEVFQTSMLKRRIVLAKEKAAQMAEDAINNPPPAPAPDSEEAVAAAAAAAAQAAKVAEAARKAREQEEAYRTALETWEQDTSALRAAERERLLAAMRTRRAERATERAGIEEKLKLLQAQSLLLMRQLKLVSAHEETQKRRAKGVEEGEAAQWGSPAVPAAQPVTRDSPWGGGGGGGGQGQGQHQQHHMRQSMGPPGGYSQGRGHLMPQMRGPHPGRMGPPQMGRGRGGGYGAGRGMGRRWGEQ